MKKIYTIIVAALFSATAFAQAPQQMSYQAVIRDGSNALVVNKTVGMQISILQGSASGTAVYSETQTPTTNANGLVSISFGSGAGFSSINWGAGTYFIETQTDPTGGTNYTITGTSQLLSVPYALYAKTAGFLPTQISLTNDTLYLGHNQYMIIPGISAANPIRDADGNTYNYIKIGTQIWMKQNLRTTKFNDGTVIPNVTNATQWGVLSTGAQCTYKNTTNVDTINTYGRLYNWFSVNTNELCPLGWHVPSDLEWTTLENYLIANGYNFDGTTTGNKFAKSLASTTGWVTDATLGDIGNSPSSNNSTGYTALPNGYRNGSGGFIDIGRDGNWWSSTTADANNATGRYLGSFYNNMINLTAAKLGGFSVRCLKN